MATREELENQTVADLRDLAADEGLEGYSSMRKAELIDALADDGAGTSTDTPAASLAGSDPSEPEQTPQQEAVNEGRTGLDPVLADAKAAAREREAEAPPRATPYRREVEVVGREIFEESKRSTRQAEADAAGTDVREGPAAG